jgi:organic radical activating enzyme
MNKKVIFLKEIKDRLDEVSPSMCLAKWTQSTIYLNSGHTHSCHHPGVHKIPLEGLDENPGMIHNTPHKMELRQEMLDGKRPTECDYCWRIEDLGKEHMSDRIFKSADPWSAPKFGDVIASGQGKDFAPIHLEVLFESTCNFSCVYCMPDVSSKWYAEVKEHGPYEMTGYTHGMITERVDARFTLGKSFFNPYIDAFWKSIEGWWPSLRTFRITGGEPLLSKNTWSMMDFVEENANKELTFAINTNLGVPDDKIQMLIDRSNQIIGNLQDFCVYTSVEASGLQAEYIRTGMDYAKFINNCKRVLEETSATLIVMTTINVLSYSTFEDFVNTFLDLRKKYKTRVRFSFNFLRNPECLDVRHLPRSLKDEWLISMNQFIDGNVLSEEEALQLGRVRDYLDSELEPGQQQIRLSDLKTFTTELDRRRGLDFPNTFPELHALLQQ